VTTATIKNFLKLRLYAFNDDNFREPDNIVPENEGNLSPG